MQADIHAREFLLSIDPRCSIRKIGRAVFDEAEADEDFARVLDDIQRRMGDGRALISEQHGEMFDRVRSRGATLDIPTSPDWLRPVIAVAYLKAKDVVSRGGAVSLIGNLKPAMNKVSKLVDNLESDFVGELLLETTLTARDDPLFAERLAAGAKEFRGLVDDLYGPLLGGVDAAGSVVTARARSKGSCQACRGSQCTSITCWVIVVVIAIILIGK